MPPHAENNLRNKLLEFRKKLLDLSLRNRLLNFRPSKRFTIGIENSFQEVYERLIDGEETVILAGYPDDEEEEVRETDGFRCAHKDGDLTARCGKVNKEARGLERDSGINHLHIGLGWVTWYEDRNADTALSAPLLLIPIVVEKDGTDANRGVEQFSIKYDSTEVVVNPCLREKLTEFGLKLPEPHHEADEDPSSSDVMEFLAQVQELVSTQPRWKLEHRASIIFVSFAKLRMYLDLDPAKWPTERALESHPLIQTVFGDSNGHSASQFNEVPPESIEKDKVADSLPLVIEADSSQHAAIHAAASGANMVIHGPPGTGKSQTITNIIATLIHAGKRVLFVAEKFAALDVVKRNLEEVELGQFVFELHGTKSNRSAAYKNLGKRLDYEAGSAWDLKPTRSRWEAVRTELNAHAAALKVQIGPDNENFQSLNGKVQKLKQEGTALPLGLKPDGKPGDDFHRRLEFLSEVEPFVSEGNCLDLHAWRNFDLKSLPPGTEDQLIDSLRDLRQLLQITNESEAKLNDALHTKVCQTFQYWNDLSSTVLALFDTPLGARWDYVSILADPSNRKVLELAIQRKERITSLTVEAEGLLTVHARAKIPEGTKEALSQIEGTPLLALSPSELPWDLLPEFIASIGKLRELCVVANGTNLPEPTTVESAETLRDQLAVIGQAPAAIEMDICEIYFNDSAPTVFQEAKSRASELRDRKNQLGKAFSITSALSAADVESVRQELAVHGHSFLKRIFSSQYRKAKARCLPWLSDPKKYKYSEILGQLQSLGEWLNDSDAFRTDARFVQYLGQAFVGVDSNWNRIQTALDWCQDAGATGLTYVSASQCINKFGISPARDLAEKLSSVLNSVTTASPELCEAGIIDQHSLGILTLEKTETHLQGWSTWLDANIRPLHEAGEPIASMPLTVLLQSIEKWKAVDEAVSEFVSDARLPQLLGNNYKGQETNFDEISRTIEWVNAFQSCPLEKEWTSSLLKSDNIETWNSAKASLSNLLESLKQTCGLIDAIQSAIPNLSEWAKCREFPSLVTSIDELLNSHEMLPIWATYCRRKERASEHGLGQFFEALEKSTLSSSHLSKAFELIEYTRLCEDYFKANPALSNFVSETHDERRRRFQELDAMLLRCHRKEVAHSASSNDVPKGNGSGKVGTWTDKALIQHQATLQKRHIPIRQMMERATDATRALKPCFMMSPLTVAQFLPPHLEPFDVLIMDEASQIRPEDAIGAIARANQLIVVGDPKQLPPTNFFGISSDDGEDDEEASAVEMAESILDCCQGTFSQRNMLKWHYRSLHESLIAFSNSEFYDNSLLIFPCNDPAASGIQYRHIEGAIYEGRRNVIEAQAVIAAIVEHFETDATRSLAVITFNIVQKELIDDLLAEECRKNPLLEAAIAEAEKSDEPFLVRNLENIQGEQRDVVFISCTYGPDRASGEVLQRFGPLNSASGGRRLNVMFTRAKRKMVVFTSMRSEDIKIKSPDEKTGRGYLRRFLKYAESGVLDAVALPSGRDADSSFEVAVADFLRSQGLSVAVQIGVAGFFVDMAVCHPDHPDRYVLGIECDGAGYHSSKTARDRDRLREEVLRSRGWNLHRVWSTDWLYQRNAAQKKLLAAVSKHIS